MSRILVSAAAVLAVILSGAGWPLRSVSAQSTGIPGEAVPAIGRGQATTGELMARETELLIPLSTEAVLDAAANVTTGSTFTGVNLLDTSSSFPDGSLAAGPTQLVIIANGRLRTITKLTGARDGVLELRPNTFFTSLRAGLDVFSGRVRFDHFSGRWFITVSTRSSPGTVLIAVSNAATITSATTWNFTSFSNSGFAPGSCQIDGPTLGLDRVAMYLGVNQFCGGTYSGTSAFVVQKTSVQSGASPTVTAFHNLTGSPTGAGPFTPQGVDHIDGSSAFGYFIGVDNSAFGSLVLRRVTDPGGTPTISANISLGVAATALPIAVRHRGGNVLLSGGDDRLASVTLRSGRLWAAHAIGVTEAGTAGATRNGVRWYEIGSLDGTPSVVQSGTVYSSGGPGSVNERNYWTPSIATNNQSRTVIGFSAAGTNEYVNAGAADRVASDPAGTFTTPSLYTSSSTSYNPPTDAALWGTYSSTMTDGCDDTTLWTLQQFVDGSNSYALQVASIRTAPPPTPISVSPATVTYNVPSIDLTVTTSGGEFFDPGATFACHPGASISGVTVNSVTLLSATSLRVNISTVGATSGDKTITVTNPDGQNATSASPLLTVISGSLPSLSLDSPANNASIRSSVSVSGWAIDRANPSGTGVDAIHAYAFPRNGDGTFGAGIFLGVAAYGSARADIGGIFGSRFTNSGFSLTSPALPTGSYRVIAYARSSLLETFNSQASADVTIASSPVMSMDAPGNGSLQRASFTVSGWAADLTASSGSGVDAVHVYAYLITGTTFGAPLFLGEAAYGAPRTDVGGVFGSQFTNSAFSLSASLGAGSYRVIAYARSTVTASFSMSRSADMIVGGPVMSLDGPADGQTVSQPVLTGGWAVDLGASSGPGVDAVHVWAFPVGGGAGNFVAQGNIGGSRPDVGAVFGAQFTNSGYTFLIGGLAPGQYDLGVYVRSTVAGTFNQVRFVRVTIQ